MQKKPSTVRNAYALFTLCNPELIRPFISRIPSHEIVAAKLITSTHNHTASVCINSIEDEQYKFNLDLESRTYQSKGDWIWVKQIDIYFPNTALLNINIDPRVIDLPYKNNNICAHWLFKNVTQELYRALDYYL